MGYILEKKDSGNVCYVFRKPTGGIRATNKIKEATVFKTQASALKAKNHAPKKLKKYKIKEFPEKTVNSKKLDLPEVKIDAEIGLDGRISFSQEIRNRVYNKAKGKCAYCGNFVQCDKFTIDHIIPLSKGGTNDEENLQCCCKKCNQMKQDLNEAQFLKHIKKIIKHQKKMKKKEKKS